MDMDVERFWRNREAEIGEEVRAYALARVLPDEGNPRANRWGLVYCTDTRLFFQRFAQNSWFGAIMSTMRRDRIGEEAPSRDEATIDEIHLAAFRAVEMPPVRWWRRILSGPPRVMTLVPAHRERAALRIEVADKGEALRSALAQSIERAQLG